MTLRKRIERLESRQARPGAIPRYGEPRDCHEVQSELDAWKAQLEEDRAAGVTARERAERDLQSDLERYTHPDDQAEIMHWHAVCIGNIAQIEAMP